MYGAVRPPSYPRCLPSLRTAVTVARLTVMIWVKIARETSTSTHSSFAGGLVPTDGGSKMRRMTMRFSFDLAALARSRRLYHAIRSPAEPLYHAAAFLLICSSSSFLSFFKAHMCSMEFHSIGLCTWQHVDVCKCSPAEGERKIRWKNTHSCEPPDNLSAENSYSVTASELLVT